MRQPSVKVTAISLPSMDISAYILTPLLSLLLLLISLLTFADGNLPGSRPVDPARFSENKGQWESNVLYRQRLMNGSFYLEKDRMTVSLYDQDDLDEIFHHSHDVTGAAPAGHNREVGVHAFEIRFLNSNSNVQVNGLKAWGDYENYYQGDDESKWASNVLAYGEIYYDELYAGIDMNVLRQGENIKYNFFVDPHADASKIKLQYEGLDEVSIINGELMLRTSVGDVKELAPYAYQEILGQKVTVACEFVLNGTEVTFNFPNGYNSSFPLVIDPVLVFSTYTGSTADNFGFTATYDDNGNFYAGGIAFNFGYPVTLGAYQTNYVNGVDVSITKYNPTGTALIYSTYLGGSGDEAPSSLVVNNNDELVVLGVTGSSNFPTTLGAYDRSFGFGTSVNFTQNGTSFPSGTDIFVSKFNATGTNLIGSTYVGGSANDGVNQNSTTLLQHNYGDQFRGEVIVDGNGNIYITSSTRSSNFPTTFGAFQSSLSGIQDAVVFSLNPTLTTLSWSTYFGGTGYDAGYSLKLHPNGSVYVTGGTTSSNIPNTAGSIDATYGGSTDGYVTRMNNGGTTITRSSYFGTSSYDQSYFVEIDGDGDVYVIGQTRGSYPVQNAPYSNAGGSQFIHKFNAALTATVYSTRFGSGTSTVNISPTAFLVDICENVYVAGWGGSVNNGWNGSTGSTFNMPLTIDAQQSTTDGSDFYFIVFETDMTGLLYATYFGGNNSQEHVDGGTSRFDKDGIMYQAVCAGCGGNSLFPTTPGAWSNTNNSSNCNLGSIKIEFQLGTIDVDAQASPASGCSPLTVQFTDNGGFNNVNYTWEFGDGNSSNQASPTHTYFMAGTYQVTLIGVDNTTCSGIVLRDTSFITVNVFPTSDTAVINAAICDGQTYFAGGALQTTAGTYFDTYQNSFGCDSVVQTNLTVDPTYVITENVTICQGDSYMAGGGMQTMSGTYTDDYLTAAGCDSTIITILTVSPATVNTQQLTICEGDSIFLEGAYQTTSGTYFDSTFNQNCLEVTITELAVLPPQMMMIDVEICDGESYFVGGAFQTTSGAYNDTFTDALGCDSILVTFLEVLPNAFNTVNVDICDGDSYFAGGALQTTSGTYVDTFTAANGCDSVLTTVLTVNPAPVTTTTADICDGDSIFLGGAYQTTAGTYYDTIVGAGGCLDVTITELTVTPLSRTMLDVSICDGDSYFVGGALQTTAGTYVDTLTGSNGCDSIITTFLEILPHSFTTLDVEICDGDSYFVGGALQTAAGTYFDTLTAANGCDSIITTFLEILPHSFTTLDVEICDGDSYFVGGALQTSAGTYFDTLTAANGCDSVITTNLILLPHSFTTVNVAICAGESYFVGGANQTNAGTYFDTLTAANGCDSIITTNLAILEHAYTEVDAFICAGDSLFVGGDYQDIRGTYYDTLVAANGCDSVIATNLTLLAHSFTTLNVAICDGDSYFVGGADQTTAGTYFDTLTAANGCDSVITTFLELLPHSFTTLNVEICDGDSYFVGGANQTTAGTYLDTLVSANGCDSVITTNLSLLPHSYTTIDTSICEGDTLRGVVYLAGDDTTLIDSLVAANGCDSVVSTNVTVLICCPAPTLLCDTVTVPQNQLACGNFMLPDPDYLSNCALASLTSDWAGGPFPPGETVVTWIAENIFGYRDTCQQVVVYNPSTLVSSYTILGIEGVELMPTNNVESGSVGVMDPNGEAYLQNHTTVTSTGSEVRAANITTFPNTVVSNPVNAPAQVTLPPFETNPTTGGPDVVVYTNQTVTLTDTAYGRISLYKGARVIFSNPYGIVNVQTIRAHNKAAGFGTVLDFDQCTKVRVTDRIDMGPGCTINPDSFYVIFYVESANADINDNQPAADIGPKSVVIADFYVPNGRFYAHPGSNVEPAIMTGTFIAKWVYGSPDIVWNRRAICDSSYFCPSSAQRGFDGTLLNGTADDVSMFVYPNPFRDITTVQFRVPETERIQLKLYNIPGQELRTIFEGVVDGEKLYQFDLESSDLARGMYFLQLTTEKNTYTQKLILMK